MNWYELIEGFDNCLPRHFMANDEELFGYDLYDLSAGRVLENWNPQAALRSTKRKYDGLPDDFLSNAMMAPVFSARLRAALAQGAVGAGDIQYLPVRVFRSTGEELPGFAVANIITRIPALDREHSTMLHLDEEIDPLTGMPNVAGVGIAALRKDLLVGHDLFRLTEFHLAAFVSQRFVDACQSIGFTGATFRRAPTY